MAKRGVICDTDVMIDYFDQSKQRHLKTKSILENEIQPDNIVLTAISKLELLSGAINNNEMNIVDQKLARYNIVLINKEITLKAFHLMVKYRCSHGLALPDCIIAASTLILDLPIFTYNKKDFKFISGLTFYK